MRTRNCTECGAPLGRRTRGDLCRTHSMRARAMARWADDDFRVRHRAAVQGPLARLTPTERVAYDRARPRMSREAALRAAGRADLVDPPR